MKYGFILPEGDARAAAELGREAEQNGWDGFFVLDPVCGVHVWVALTAVAMQTERIRLGPVLVPVSRTRPWELASATATLDNLSHGRVVLPVGLGDTDEFEPFGEITDRKTRAERLDEGLEILTRLWTGEAFSYPGKHFQVEGRFSPPLPPVQQPRIPIWVVGAWPSEKSMQRALRYDGLLPQVLKPATDGAQRSAQRAEPADLHAMRAYLAQHRADRAPFDIVVEGDTPGDDLNEAAKIVAPWADAGATWWLEAPWEANTLAEVRRRIRQGPPTRETSRARRSARAR
jgi:alkanesulfonate monooxygenase SsuD/methylene tetrahydromethanopterin reductase-like flavin-dependent oxidoreductase (luciferase family)